MNDINGSASEPDERESAESKQEEAAATFADYGFHESIRKAIDGLGWKTPTPIQAKAIVPAIEGRDLIGLAETGSGKTAGFLLPTIQRLIGGRGFRAMIIGPTRELVNQTYEVALQLTEFCDLKPVRVYGGVPMRPQTEELAQTFDILIATPGRMLDHVYAGNLDFPNLQTLIIDEADRMFDMGFEPDITRIISLLPPERQTMLFSATMPPEIEGLAKRALAEPSIVEVGRRAKPVDKVSHSLMPVQKDQKTDLLVEILFRERIESLIVFVRTKIMADDLAYALDRRRFPVARLHSNRTQQQREAALAGFRCGRYQILVATDVASRGLDITGISHVINYDVPMHCEDYVHRIGRTARAGEPGIAYTFVTPQDSRSVRGIERFIRMEIPERFLENFPYKHVAVRTDDGKRGRGAGRDRHAGRGGHHGQGGRKPGGARRSGKLQGGGRPPKKSDGQ